jgi:hypothetical protein
MMRFIHRHSSAQKVEAANLGGAVSGLRHEQNFSANP